MLHEACPEVAFDVVPRVEFNLDDVAVVAEFLLRHLRLPRLARDHPYALLHLLHEEGLPGSPFAEQADRQRRLDGPGADQRGHGFDVACDADPVRTCRGVGGVSGESRVELFRRDRVEQRQPGICAVRHVPRAQRRKDRRANPVDLQPEILEEATHVRRRLVLAYGCAKEVAGTNTLGRVGSTRQRQAPRELDRLLQIQSHRVGVAGPGLEQRLERGSPADLRVVGGEPASDVRASGVDVRDQPCPGMVAVIRLRQSRQQDRCEQAAQRHRPGIGPAFPEAARDLEHAPRELRKVVLAKRPDRLWACRSVCLVLGVRCGHRRYACQSDCREAIESP